MNRRVVSSKYKMGWKLPGKFTWPCMNIRNRIGSNEEPCDPPILNASQSIMQVVVPACFNFNNVLKRGEWLQTFYMELCARDLECVYVWGVYTCGVCACVMCGRWKCFKTYDMDVTL